MDGSEKALQKENTKKLMRLSVMLITTVKAVTVSMGQGEAHALDRYQCRYSCNSTEPNPIRFLYVCDGSRASATPHCKKLTPSGCTQQLRSPKIASGGCSNSAMTVTSLPGGGTRTSPSTVIKTRNPVQAAPVWPRRRPTFMIRLSSRSVPRPWDLQ